MSDVAGYLEGNPRPLRVFLCHSSGDKPAVRNLYQWLRSEGFDAWLDEEKLDPGVDWAFEIPRAVRFSDVVLVCLSRTSITKAGYVQKEIRHALDVADEQPDGTIFLIPVKLEDCEVPERLRRWHWVDLSSETGRARLIRALLRRAESSNLKVSPLFFIPKAEGFLDEAHVRATVASHLRGTEEIEGLLLLFEAEAQRTWLVSTTTRLFCLLDDDETRRTQAIVQWVLPRERSPRIAVRKTSRHPTAGLVDIGPHLNWLYSHHLFPPSASAVAHIVTQLARAHLD